MAEIIGMTASRPSGGAAASASAAATTANLRSSRFNDFNRTTNIGNTSAANTGSPSAAPAASSGSTEEKPAAHKSWVWGSGTIGGGFGQSAGSSDQRRANDPEMLEGSSSLLPGSGEHDSSWSSAAKPWGGESAKSPGMASAGLTQDLSRSPVRVRGANQSTDLPRSTSPYYQLQRANPGLSSSPSSKSYLDPAAANGSIGEKLDFQGRGRASDVGQFGHGGNQRLSGSGFGPMLSSAVGEDPHSDQLRRGRGLSGSRSIIPGAELLGPGASNVRSESLPPQGRTASSPPSNLEQSPPNGSGFPSYTHIPQTNALSGLPPQLSGYPNSIQQAGRYGNLNKETREAEMLASQFEQMGVDDMSEQAYPLAPRNRPPFHNFSHSQGSISSNFSFPQAPQFGDLYSRPPIPGTASPWAPMDDAGGAMSPSELNGDGYGRRGMGSPYFPGTPPSGLDNYRTPSRGGSQGRNQLSGQIGPLPEKLRQQLLMTQQQQQQQSPFGGPMMRGDMYRHSFQPPSPYRYDAYGIPLHMAPYPASFASMPDPRVMQPLQPQTRSGDLGNLRSVLLEEFRSSSKSNKRYELKDIYHHVVEFSGDQHGSRFIQQKLETANSDEKEQVFSEIRPNSLQLMTDVFGNYVIQKFFEHGSQVQKTVLARQMEGHVLTLSLQMYGCRVVQKALEHILTDQQATLVKELDGHVLKCVKDQNGNHVVQKAIERVPAEHIGFIVKAFNGHVHALATHPYGCRVIQRLLEHCSESAQASVLRELHACCYALIQDQYGNYVTQHVIEHGRPEDRAKIINVVTSQLLQFSKHKFASNVVEKSIAFGTPEQKSEIVRVVTTPKADGQSPLLLLMRDQYGNYVVQKLLGLLSGKDREILVDQIKIQLAGLKKFAYGKQISAIEKLIFTPPSSSAAGSPTPRSAAVSPDVVSPPRGPKVNGHGIAANGAPPTAPTAPAAATVAATKE